MGIIVGADNGGTNRTVLTDSQGRLIVETNGSAGTPTIITATNNIAASVTSTLLTYTVPALKDAELVQVVCSSSVRGLYEVKIEGTVQYRVRTSGSEKTVIVPGYNLTIAEGETLTVDVTNDYHQLRQFDVTAQVNEIDQ